MRMLRAILAASLLFFCAPAFSSDYAELAALFADWRAFETPPDHQGAPDYRAETFAARQDAFLALEARLEALDRSNWSTAEQVDWEIVRAEMNGYDFNRRVLQPWVRDPAFYATVWTYRSDVPAHEGPTNHALTELWTYEFPLSPAASERLASDLAAIPPLYRQARQNLTGNARDLWVTGIRDIRAQATVLAELQASTADTATPQLADAISNALTATEDFVSWLEAESASKTGPSGIGREQYSWYLQNVHLVPMTWEDEVRLLERELDRAWSMLALEEHRNRKLPELEVVKTPAEYDALAERAARDFMDFLADEDVVTVAAYFEPALRGHLGEFVPEERRNFFYIGTHYDPRPLFSHFYHWFELARMDNEPHASPIRRDALLYNIFDSRNEGVATAVEEIFMHAGMYDDSPRVREIVWIMLAQRAARGLGSLYAHANEMTMEEAGRIHLDWTPRGWMKTEEELVIFEQHLYLRQPGYGTSYVTGKYLLDRTVAAYAKMREAEGEAFELKAFLDELNSIGNIPISLGQWQMTGERDLRR